MALAVRQHRFIRFLAIAVTATSLTYMAARSQVRSDVTAEGLSELTSDTEALIAGITTERPVFVHAYVSEEVPREYVPVRSRLLNVLREMEARGGAGLRVSVVAPAPNSEEAQEAIEKYGITPRQVYNREAGRTDEMQVFLGMAFVSGPREEVVPFVDRGLSVEYEVARALRTVTQDKKKVVGVFRTDAVIMGNFDFASRRQDPAWRIVDELKKQYEVRSLNPGTAVPEDVDVLFVPQLSSATQEQLDIVKLYVDTGRPALITIDPMPLFDLRLAPSEPMLPPPGQQQQGMMFGGPPPSAPKGDYKALLAHIGVQWDDGKILYDTFNPHPSFADVPPQVVFVSERPDGTRPFAGADPAVDGLSEVVVLYGGEIQAAAGHESEVKPLLVTGKTAGFSMFDDMVNRHMLFGLQGPMPPRRRSAITGQQHVIAARVQSAAVSAEAGEKAAAKNVVVLADLDMFGDQFFAMHERGGDIDGDGLDDIRFDNVSFLLNVVDSLAGDDRFIELRKRKPEYRRLTRVDELTRESRSKRERQMEEANATAQKELQDAQAALDQAVAAIRERADLDETTKAIMLSSVEDAENRRLKAKQERIELKKAREVTRIEAEHQRKVAEVQNRIRLLAVLVPPIPALLMGFIIFGRKRRREQDAIPLSRRTGSTNRSGGET